MCLCASGCLLFFFFQAEDGIRDIGVTGVQSVLFRSPTLMGTWWGIGISVGRIVITATFAVVLGAVLPLMAINWRATRTRTKTEEQFTVALDVCVSGLRPGHPIAAALHLLTTELPAPIGPAVGTVDDEVTYGA